MELPVSTQRPGTGAETKEEDFSSFWSFEIVNSKTGEIKWKIDHRKFIEYLRANGFRRFDFGKDYIFVIIINKVIDEIAVTLIQDKIIDYITSLELLENESNDEFTRKENALTVTKGSRVETITVTELLSKFYTSPAIYFNDKKLSMLGTEPGLKFNADTKNYSFIYYKNGFVQCSAEGFNLFPYSDLSGHIFKNQIKDRKFEKYSDEGMFKTFVFNVANKNQDRFLALQTMIGYLLHGYYETKMKAVNLTDSTISDVAEGRTGKTLLGIGISYVKKLTEISGKDFDPKNKHKYSEASIDTQIIFLNDVKKDLKLESLFNDISDTITIDRKNLQPFKIKAKMLISSNNTFGTEGASAKDRIIEFEFSEHYSPEFSPEDDFKCWFFRDWDQYEWLRFDNFMLNCISTYLQHGVIEADSINLEKRKKIEQTNPDFVEFMDEKIDNGEIKAGFEYDKKELHNEFLEKYPEWKEDRWLKRSANFTKYLKTYACYSPQLKGTVKERRPNGKSLIRFGFSEEKQSELPF